MEENKENKSINHFIRSLHRDIGFFVIGLTIIYSISGIVLTYRNTDFLKFETTVERTLSPNMEASELGKVLRLKDFKVLKNEGGIEYFQNGTYDRATGLVKYSEKKLPVILEKLVNLHKASTKNFKQMLGHLTPTMRAV